MKLLRGVSRTAVAGALVFVVAETAGFALQDRQVIRLETTSVVQGGGPQGSSNVPMSPVQQNGTGLIVGQVVEAGSDRGIPGVIVTLGGATPGAPVQAQTMQFISRDGGAPVVINSSNPSSLPRLITDAEGRFAFRNLPKGQFNITAAKPGFLDGAYGRLRPNGSSTPIELADDERAGEFKVRLFRTASIGGTVLDDLNDPVVGVQVRAYRRSLVAGRRVLTPTAGTATTDDRGVYRIANLIPGEYVVALQTMQSSVPASMQLDGPLMGDLMTTLIAGSGGGSVSFSNSGTPVMPDGKFLLQSNNGYSAVGPRGRMLVYPTQYYPSANSVTNATPIVVASGEDRTGVDLNLRLVPTINVSGRLMGPDGPTANFVLHLVPSDSADLSNDPDAATTITDANGEFQFLAVPAGQYVIQTVRIQRGAAVGDRVAANINGAGMVTGAVSYTVNVQTNAAGAGSFFSTNAVASSTQPALWLATPITLADTDVSDLLLTMRQGLKLSGRIEFDGAAERPPADRMATISVIVESADGKQKAQVPPARVDGTGQFTVQGVLPGKYVLRATNVPGGWSLKGATSGGMDITDTPFDVEDRDLSGITVTLFDRPSELRGTVRGSGSATDVSAAVVVFPADTRSWTNYGVNPRRMRMLRTSKNGQYTFSALPAGDYFAAAISDEVAGEWQDPQFLDQLTRGATRVTVGEGQKVSQDLAILNVRAGGDLRPLVEDHETVTPGHGPFVDERENDQARTQTQTQSRDPQPQTRDTTPTPTGTGTLAGIVTTDDGPAQPMRRARVTARTGDGRLERQGATDDAGRFSITGLPAGTYTLMVSKPSYLAAYYGSKRPGRGPGVPIALAAGQALTNLSLKMAKGGVVSGTIRDDYGMPVGSASVRLMQFRTVNGERTLTGQQSAMTDDRGVYRVFGLVPANYVVSVTPPASLGQNEIRQLSNADLQAAMSALQQPPQPGASSGTNVTPGSPRNQAPSRPVGRTVGFAPVYYPGTLVQADATTVPVAAGQEVNGIDLPVRLVATARLEGIVIGADGRPSTNTSLNLVSAEPGQAGAGTPKFANTNNEGKFSILNVPPGRYTLSARGGGAGSGAVRFAGGDFIMATPVGAPPGAPPPPPPPPPPLSASQYATADVDINGEDVSGVTLQLQEAMTITGRVVFAGKTLPPPANLSRTRLTVQAMNTGGIVIGIPDATIDAAGTFKITNVVPGRYRMVASVPGGGPSGGGGGAAAGWVLRSAVLDGRDVLDSPFEIRAGQNLSNMVVTFVDQPTEISGTLMDSAGKPMPGFSIVVFSTNRATWSAGSRRISPPIQVASDGKYKVTGLPPGEYFLSALTDYENGDLGDVSFLDQIAAVAIKVTLGEGEKKTQDLKIGG